MRYSSIINHVMVHSLDLICTIDAEKRFIQVNEPFSRLLGCTGEELKGQYANEHIHPEDDTTALLDAEKIRGGSHVANFQRCYIREGEQKIPIRWSAVWSEEDNFFFCMAHKAFEESAALEDLNVSRELHNLAAKYGTDVLTLLDENGNILYLDGASLKEMGYRRDQLIGENVLHLIYPNDIDKAREAFDVVIQTTQEYVKLPDIRLKAADGQWQWVEATICSQLENPVLKSLFVTSRNVTQQRLAQARVLASEQRFKSLFENNPNMVVYQSEEGIVLDANASFFSFINKQQEDVIDKPLFDFLPAAVTPIFKQKLKEAFSGNKVSFEVDATFEEQGQKVLSVVKIPLITDNKVVAIHAVISDITGATHAHRLADQHARKLNTILESITDAFYALDKNWNFTYINCEFERLLQKDRKELLGQNIWSSFPEEISHILYHPFHQAAKTGETIHFESYFHTFCKWFDLSVYPSEEGLSVYFNDVTERVASKKELEKLSLVASKTTNSVIITDAQGLTEWVNDGFTHMTGYTLSDIIGKKPGTVLQGPETDPETVKRISEKLKSGKPFSDEILNYKKSGEKFFIHKEITPIYNDAGELTKFIAIQNDVTERKKNEEELKKLSLVASKTSNSVIILDAQGRIEWVNEGFTRLTGYSLDEMVGRRPGDVLNGPKTDTAEMQRILDNRKQGLSFNSMLLHYRKSGEPFWISIDFSPVFDEAGNLSHYIAIQKDITFRKEAEANLLRMSQDLYEHNRDLQQFTYIISHNLRAPVANAMGLSKLLMNMNKDSEEFDVFLKYLNESVARMDDVLKDVNMILSIRDKKNVLEKESIKVADVCRQAVEDLQEPLRQSGGQVNLAIAEGLLVQANKAYLYSIFHNLLYNTIKYRSDERTLQVLIQASMDQEGRAVISFSDNGSGFDMNKAGENIFKLYKRFHVNKEGKGIGLFLVKTHVEAMGGQVEVSSEVGVGTSFTIYLKASKA